MRLTGLGAATKYTSTRRVAQIPDGGYKPIPVPARRRKNTPKNILRCYSTFSGVIKEEGMRISEEGFGFTGDRGARVVY
jgi:hypothetical protein